MSNAAIEQDVDCFIALQNEKKDGHCQRKGSKVSLLKFGKGIFPGTIFLVNQLTQIAITLGRIFARLGQKGCCIRIPAEQCLVEI